MSTMTTCKQASLEDLTALHHYLVQLRQESPNTVFKRPPPELADTEKFIKTHVGTNDAVSILAFQGTLVVGMIDLRRGNHPQTYHTGSFGMSVASSYRGQGIGRRLIGELEIWCRLHKIRRMELEVFSNNSAAIHLYESCGFQHEGRRVGAVKIDEKYEDILIMAKQGPLAA